MKHKAILLRLGQRICALLLHGILRGQHEERFLKRVCGAAGCDGMFLHRLQQRGLRLRGRAVDFIRQNHLGKNRAAQKHETTSASSVLLNDIRTGDVCRHEIGRKLHTPESKTERLRKTLYHVSFREAWHAFKQTMTTGKNSDDDLLYNRVLSDDRFTHLGGYAAICTGEFLGELFIARADHRSRHGFLGRGGAHSGHHQQRIASGAFQL